MSKQDNLRQFRGQLKRELRRTEEKARNELQEKRMRESERIKVDWWDMKDKPNRWCFIRLNFEKPIVPNEGFNQDLILVLEGLCNEYLQR